MLPLSQQPFGSILHLVPMAESVVKLQAVCMICFKDAAFTKRLGSETEVCFNGLICIHQSYVGVLQVEVIGGSDKYMAVCRTCYNLPDKPHLTSTTPIRGGEVSTGRQLFRDKPIS